ncbi:hypothetical protein OQD07_005000 [Escherichia coli]|nr:hypothetical protein [Escherichia coli]
MRLTYVGDVKPGEIDILTQNQHYPLVISSLEGEKIYMQAAPKEGWTHETLQVIQPDCVKNGADAYLNEQWIGSTEV